MSELLTTATSRDEVERQAKVAVLPIGSFEQHGDYLPLATDTLVASVIAREVATAYELLLLPPVTISCSHEHAGWLGTVSISAATLYAIVNDIRGSLRRSGVKKLVIVNGHGGNYVLANVVQEANVNGPTVALFPATYDWKHARQASGCITSAHEDMHAGELETSILLHATPDAVRAGFDSSDWEATLRPYLLTLGMAGYTTSGVIGRPSLGTAEKGKAILASLTEALAGHLRALGEPPNPPV